MEEAAIGLDAIASRRQHEVRAPVEQDKVRLLVARDLERRGRGGAPPQALAVEEVHLERQEGVDRAQPERSAVLEEVDACGPAGVELELGRDARQTRFAQLHPRERQHGAGEEAEPPHGQRPAAARSRSSDRLK